MKYFSLLVCISKDKKQLCLKWFEKRFWMFNSYIYFLKQTSEKNGYRAIYYVSEIITKDTLKK